jgi:IS5 family transposase
MSGQRSMFGVDERYAALSASVDPLQRLLSVVDFEVFRPILSSALALLEGAKGGPPPYDPVLMFKLLVLQALYSLSDEQAEFQMRDRLSFRRFVGLEFHDPVPDAKTIWLYREQLKRAGEMESLFRRLDAMLTANGYLAMGGQIVEATVAARKQELTEDEEVITDEGGTLPGWPNAKRRQKDCGARWTVKREHSNSNPGDGAVGKSFVRGRSRPGPVVN